MICQNKIKKIDILKIDTEGHELYILKGSENLIKNRLDKIKENLGKAFGTITGGDLKGGLKQIKAAFGGVNAGILGGVVAMLVLVKVFSTINKMFKTFSATQDEVGQTFGSMGLQKYGKQLDKCLEQYKNKYEYSRKSPKIFLSRYTNLQKYNYDLQIRNRQQKHVFCNKTCLGKYIGTHYARGRSVKA